MILSKCISLFITIHQHPSFTTYYFLVASAALVLERLEIAPLALHVLVRLHLHLAFAPFDAIFVVPGNEVIEHECIDAFRAVLGQNANHLQVDDVGLMELQCAQHVPPAKGPQAAAMAFL